jgi:hypothetical protein
VTGSSNVRERQTLWLAVNEMRDSIRHEVVSKSEPMSELYGKPVGRESRRREESR